MGIEHFVVVTCDRCKSEKRYDPSDRDYDWEADWSRVWPAVAAPVELSTLPPAHMWPKAIEPILVCPDCLTAEEHEQREAMGNAEDLNHNQLPF